MGWRSSPTLVECMFKPHVVRPLSWHMCLFFLLLFVGRLPASSVWLLEA